MTDSRSKRIVLVSHCLLNMNSKFDGGAKYPDVAPFLLDLFHKHELGIEQMPCPELNTFGIDRKPATKEMYDTPDYRKSCKNYADFVARSAEHYKKAGYKILAIVGYAGSPSCGAMTTHIGRNEKESKNRPGNGVFMEELQKVLFDIPFVDFDMHNPHASIQNIEKAIKMSSITV